MCDEMTACLSRENSVFYLSRNKTSVAGIVTLEGGARRSVPYCDG